VVGLAQQRADEWFCRFGCLRLSQDPLL
jgi:hypothetical protein